MSRDDFLRELRSRIGHLPQEELEAAMAYYQEYFDECGDDAAAWEALGSPEEAAAKILGVEPKEAEPKVKYTGPLGWLIDALSAPIWLPLLYAVGVLILVIALAGFVVLLLLSILTVNMLSASVNALYISIPTALFGFGTSILSVGLILLAAYGLLCVMRSTVKGIFLRKGA